MLPPVALLEKGGYEVLFPKNLAGLCCGMAFDSKGFKEEGSMKADELSLALLEASPAVLAEAREHLRLRWEAFAGAYAEGFGAAPRRAAGGFYHWQPLPPSALADPMAFCVRLRDDGRVVVVPGAAFGQRGRGHIRLSYGGDPDQIREGVRRLAPFWNEA